MFQRSFMNEDRPGRSFSLFGASRVGISLAYHLQRIGFRPEFVWNRNPERLALARQFVPFLNFTNELDAHHIKTDWIIIAVSDDAITEIAGKLATCGRDFDGVNICHTSGFLTSEALTDLEHKGAVTGSLHPVVSVPDIKAGLAVLEHCVYTCEGALKNNLAQLVREIGGQPYLLNRRQKQIVHLSAVFLNNHVSALINTIKTLCAENGLPPGQARAILQPVSQQAITNGWDDSVLTGPLMRGDFKTIEQHLDLLGDYPELKTLYQNFIDLALKVKLQTPH